jgi:phosphomannomutase/phosphoglucomutase
VARVAKPGTRTHLGGAAPTPSRIVYVGLPASLLTQAVDSAQISDKAYLALRQGAHAIAEHGDRSLSGSADVLSRPVGETGWPRPRCWRSGACRCRS